MKMTSYGLLRKHRGKKYTHFTQDSFIRTRRGVRAEDGVPYIEATVEGDRQYTLSLTLNDLLALVRQIAENTRLGILQPPA